MFRLKMEYKPVSNALKSLTKFNKAVKDLNALGKKLKRIVVEDNKKYALQGLDKAGQDYAALRPSTIETRGGTGPPLAPRSGASRVIKRFYCDDVTSGDGRLELRAGWRGSDVEWMRYHFTGYTHRSGTRVPARNPNGIRPETMKRLRATAVKHFKDAARVSFRTTPNNGVA